MDTGWRGEALLTLNREAFSVKFTDEIPSSMKYH